MKQRPFTFSISVPDESLSEYDNHIVRRLSAMAGQYLDAQAFQTMLSDDPVLYEVYEIQRPELAGELMNGLTIVHPGKVGEEYFMTKGHFHTVLDTAEVYYCLKGHGVMVMETPEDEWSVEELRPGHVLYVPPRWAQSETRQVRVEDGWLYFLHGWTQVIGQVYHQEIAGDLFNRLAAIAGEIAR